MYVWRSLFLFLNELGLALHRTVLRSYHNKTAWCGKIAQNDTGLKHFPQVLTNLWNTIMWNLGLKPKLHSYLQVVKQLGQLWPCFDVWNILEYSPLLHCSKPAVSSTQAATRPWPVPANPLLKLVWRITSFFKFKVSVFSGKFAATNQNKHL